MPSLVTLVFVQCLQKGQLIQAGFSPSIWSGVTTRAFGSTLTSGALLSFGVSFGMSFGALELGAFKSRVFEFEFGFEFLEGC